MSLVTLAPAAEHDRVAGAGAQLAEQVTNVWSTWPSLSRWARTLARAGSERGAGAIRSVPPGGAASEKHRGAQALVQVPDEAEGEHADKDVRTYAELGVVVDRAQVQVYGLQAAETRFVELLVVIGADELGDRQL